MKKFLVLSFIAGLILSTAYSQEKQSPEEIYDDAKFFFSSGEYEEALYLYQQLLKDFPDNANLRFKTGMTYLNIPGRETKAIPHLEKAVQNTTLKYKDNKFDMKQAPHHAWFYLGNAYRINNELNKALESYEKFMDIRNFENKYNLRIVENEIAACQRAKIIKDSPFKIEKERASKLINSAPQNYRPVVNTDETVMVYMQEQKFYNAIMCSWKKDGAWTEPVNITPQVGSDGDMLPCGISPDGKELLLVKDNSFSKNDLFISSLEGNFWSKAVELPDNINSVRNEDHASFSNDGKKILFASERRGGYGKLDLWIAERIGQNSWSDPVNLGPAINSEEDETNAFLVMEDKQLFFSSKAHFNMGGYDVFFSELDGDTWTDPVNIGYPLNTTGDNKFFQPVMNGSAGYISLFNQDENMNEEDIYRIEMESLAKINLPEKKLFGESFRIEIFDPESEESIHLVYDRDADILRTESDNNKKYEVNILKK